MHFEKLGGFYYVSIIKQLWRNEFCHEQSRRFSVIAVILAITATVLAFIFIVPDKRRKKLNKFGKFIHDTLNFKYLIIEKILQALYIFFTVGHSDRLLYAVYCNGRMARRQYMVGGYGILLIFGPIVIRLFYEFVIMFVLLVKNVIKINSKLKNQNEGDSKEDIFTAPSFPHVDKAEAPAANFCVTCGSVLGEDGKCPNCDK